MSISSPPKRRRLTENQRLALIFLLLCCGVSFALGWGSAQLSHLLAR